MAKGQSIEDLYITLGLDVSELTSDFIEVDKTISENIARINRDKNFIKLNAQIDMNNLDPVKDAQEILKIKSNELNDIIEGQQQKVKLLEAAWLDLANSHGYSSDIARRAEETHLRETVALQELEKELERLKATQENASDEQLSVFAQALQSDDVTTALESIENAFSNMTEEVAESNPILQKAVNIISKFKNPYIVAGAGAVAMATLPLVAHKASEELINMARPAIEAGDAIYQLSRRMGESVKSASQFNDACKLAGTDADYLLEQLEDLSKDWLTGGSEKTEALKAFGVDFTDDEGNLKSYHDRMVELAEGMNRAAEAGQKLEYQQMLTEENTAEMVTAVENYGLALERVGGIEKNGLTDPLKAKDLGFDLRALDAQANELSNAFSAALIPVAEHLIPTVTSSLKHMVEVINQNKDTLRDLGDIEGTALSSIAGLAKYAANALAAVGAGLKEVLQDKQSAEMNIVIKNKDSKGESLGIDTYEDYKEYLKKTGTDPLDVLRANGAIITESLEREAEDIRRRKWAAIEKGRQNADKEAAARADAEKENSPENTSSKLLSEDLKKLKENLDTEESGLAERQYKSTHSAFENEIYDIEKWKSAMLESAEAVKASEEDKARIIGIAEAKIQEAIQKSTEESKSRTADYLAEAQSISTEGTMSAYEKEIAQIEKWKQKAMEKAETVQDLGQKAQEVAAIEADAAAKAADAYEKEVERIKNATKSFQDEIYELTHSQYENDMKKLWEKYQKGLSEGVDKDTMDSWFRLKQTEVNEKARHDTKGEYTRGGQFQYTPNYDVPNYVEQARQAIGAAEQQNLTIRNFDGAIRTSTQQLQQYNSSLKGYTSNLTETPNWTQVYDVFGNMKDGWQETYNSFGHILEYAPAYSNAIKNSAQSVNQYNSQFQQSANKLQQYGSQLQQGLSQQINAPDREAGWTQVYDVFGNKMEGWVEKYGSFGHIIENTLANAQNSINTQQTPIQPSYQSEPQNFQNPYDETLNSNLATASMQLQEAANSLSQVSIQEQSNQLSQITDAINNLQKGNPNPININVDIGNAVTPDSESMTWLANTVSEKVASVVENAIGNSSNSYY